MSGSDTEALLALWFLIGIPLGFVLYLVPSIVGFRRRHPNRWAILVVNLAFGGTGIGWLGSLAWALNAVHRSDQPDGSDGGESGLNIFVNDPRTVRLVRPSDPVGPGSAAPLSPGAAVVEIERLSALRAAGHLTEVEFANLKAVVLQRLEPGASA